jgi:hypothetical protein
MRERESHRGKVKERDGERYIKKEIERDILRKREIEILRKR